MEETTVVDCSCKEETCQGPLALDDLISGGEYCLARAPGGPPPGGAAPSCAPRADKPVLKSPETGRGGENL